MIREEELVEIGKFQKTHALKGELNAILDIDPDYLEDGNPIVVNIDGIFVPFYAESVRSKGATSFLIQLSGQNSIEDARNFFNKTIYGLRKNLLDYYDSPVEEIVFDSDLPGYEVIDSEHGPLGVLEHIDDTTINALMVVETPDGNEIYIPYNEDFIDSIDDEKKIIFTSLPEGLVDLNDKKDE